MTHGLRLVIGGRRGPSAVGPEAAPPRTPQEIEARALVDAWLDQPSSSVRESLDDLVARIAAALTRRDGRPVEPASSLPS